MLKNQTLFNFTRKMSYCETWLLQIVKASQEDFPLRKGWVKYLMESLLLQLLQDVSFSENELC